MKKRYLPFFISLFTFIALLFSFASARDYQGPINGYLQTIETQVNKLPNWETGFSLAKSNLDSLEQALANTSKEIQEERKQNPKYTVNIKLYSATGKRLKELEEIKNTIGDYMKKLNGDYQDMNKALSKGKNIAINNIAKSTIKYFKRIGKPEIADLDVSGEKKDAKTLENNFKNIKNMNQLMDWNREEFNRSKLIYAEAIKMVNSLKPIDNKMNEILKKYANLGKVVSESEQIDIPNIAGTWSETLGGIGEMLTISQNGSNLQVEGSFTYKGVLCQYHGTGTINGNSVEHSVVYSRLYPGWDSRAGGKLVLELSPDGKRMTGKWYNGYGSSGTKEFVKVR